MLRGTAGCIFLFSLFLSQTVLANFVGTDKEAIKQRIYEMAQHNHHSIGYSSARKDLFGDLYLEQENNSYYVTDVYCEKDYRVPGPNRVPNANVINTEHTWPQSKFGGRDRRMQKSDLHHLFPTDSQLNSIRGNHPFGYVENSSRHLKCPQSKIGRNAQGRTVFEPPHAHKGNVARALFYFSIRYNLHIDDAQEEALREWHILDPVDEEEFLRNEEIKHIQGNTNPFIEHPEYVEQVFDF